MDNRIFLADETGQEIEMEIVLTFDGPDGRHFVLITPPGSNSEDVFAYAYDEAGNLVPVDDPDDFEMCSEVLEAYDSSQGGVTNGKEKA